LTKNNGHPSCPDCGSSATLPFENEKNIQTEQRFLETMLIVFLFFLLVFIVFLLFLLSGYSLSLSLLIILILFLLWRQKKKHRQPHRRRGQYVCMDCSRNFKA
jgi:Mn2+/Fe2+ NRAMP family transporter